MEKQVFLFNVEGQEALGFDTGLDSSAFARAKFTQFITEPGLIVSTNGQQPSVRLWKASGVVEQSTMVVWGQPFKGERLDFLLADNDKRDKALAVIQSWIHAVLALGEKQQIPLWPCAALIGENQPAEVFFAPPGIALHCLMAKESNKINNRYIHPDLNNLNAAAFTAAAMLYQVFAGSPAFPAVDEITLHEDMREGNFLPIRLATPGLDSRLAVLIQNSLSQNGKKGVLPNGARLLEEFLAILRLNDGTISPSSFINNLSEADKLSTEKEKTQYLKTKTVSVNTRRFVRRNAAILLGIIAAVVIAGLTVNSVIKSRSAFSTAGMEPVEVVESYYNAFEKLDHLWMDACVVKGVGKDDISMVMNLFIISKYRQVYEQTTISSFIPAREWLEMGGGQIDLQVFGVTDLQITNAGSVGGNSEPRYRVDYTLWVPGEAEDDPEMKYNSTQYIPPISFHRIDFVTLVQKKERWLIAEIKRETDD